MLISITAISILAISTLIWLANKVLPRTVCPVCAGTFLTWAGLLVTHFLGYEINLAVPALLLGGTVVGVMYQLEKKFSSLSSGRLLLWKILFVPAGFVAAYGVLEQLWVAFFSAIGFLLLLSFTLLSSRRESASRLEKNIEDCC